MPQTSRNKSKFISQLLAMVAAIVLLSGVPRISLADELLKKYCKCRNTTIASYLQLHQEFYSGKETRARLAAFTDSGVDNKARCEAKRRSQPECRNKTAITDVTKSGSAVAGGVSLTAVKPGGTLSLIGLKTGDIVQSINGQKVKSYEDLGKIQKLAAGGGRIDVSVTRSGSVVNMWYEFAKDAAAPAAAPVSAPAAESQPATTESAGEADSQEEEATGPNRGTAESAPDTSDDSAPPLPELEDDN